MCRTVAKPLNRWRISLFQCQATSELWEVSKCLYRSGSAVSGPDIRVAGKPLGNTALATIYLPCVCLVWTCLIQREILGLPLPERTIGMPRFGGRGSHHKTSQELKAFPMCPRSHRGLRGHCGGRQLYSQKCFCISKLPDQFIYT